MLESNEYIQFSNLINDEVIHLYTKRPFNFNGIKVEKSIMNSQYEEIQKITAYQCKKIIKINQAHTDTVKKIDINNLNDKFSNIDGLVTNLKGVALVTSLADCQGILLYDPKKQVIGNLHSGWRGTLKRIVVNAIQLMHDEYFCNFEDIEVYICPNILKCCFEVDEDVKEQFLQSFDDISINSFITNGKIKDKRQKYFIDMTSINIEILKKSGILEKNIYNSNICTKCMNDKFHSHRGDKILDGRNIAFIVLK